MPAIRAGSLITPNSVTLLERPNELPSRHERANHLQSRPVRWPSLYPWNAYSGEGCARPPRRESLENFPYLEAEDIDACLKYAAAEADHPVLLAQ